MKVEVNLLLLTLIGLLFIIYITLYRKHIIREFFNDVPQGQEQAVPSQDPPTTLANNPVYQTFYAWHSAFCNTWNDVIDNAMKVDQTSMSKDDYIQTLATKQGTQFPTCSSVITANPDPILLLPLLSGSSTPSQLYKNALQYMGTEISKIKQTTEAALQGMPPSVDTFIDTPPQAPCTCTPESAKTTQAKQVAIQKIIQILQVFNQQIPALQGQLTVVQTGVQDLNSYKQKAESGDLIKEINIPN